MGAQTFLMLSVLRSAGEWWRGRGAEARGHTVKIGGELFSDAMGPAGTYAGTYIGMIDHNVSTIAGALGGDVPERGMTGKLAAGS